MVLDATTNPCQWEKLQKTHLRGGSITEYTHIKKKIKPANKKNYTHKTNAQNPQTIKQTKSTKPKQANKPKQTN